jgi:predicted nucleic acid-binding protein
VSREILLDTGPLVASLNVRDAHHAWASREFAVMPTPVLTCEAVIVEACYLLRSVAGGVERVFRLLDRQVVVLGFRLGEHHAAVHALCQRYANVPMSLADACLVRMSELIPDSMVFTLDSDFHIYRRHGRQAIPLLIPPDR